MKTEVLKVTDDNLIEIAKKAGELLRNGEVVGIPTETVYGLAANALSSDAAAKIFKAKGRPQDNPLIVHISEFNEIYDLVKDVPKNAKKLAENFWPGPLTMIMEKSSLIPIEVSGGLSTVAIRMPSHPVARAIIKASGVPLAAPSANISGSPSPTNAKYVFDDMNGKIPLIVDGGSSKVGVESTVITLVTNPPRVLRPGGITVSQLKSVLGE
ncbi:MAG: L-threonylcarbamoyladenylate synthase, partial [Oscillospiraceae bacterium]